MAGRWRRWATRRGCGSFSCATPRNRCVGSRLEPRARRQAIVFQAHSAHMSVDLFIQVRGLWRLALTVVAPAVAVLAYSVCTQAKTGRANQAWLGGGAQTFKPAGIPNVQGSATAACSRRVVGYRSTVVRDGGVRLNRDNRQKLPSRSVFAVHSPLDIGHDPRSHTPIMTFTASHQSCVGAQAVPPRSAAG